MHIEWQYQYTHSKNHWTIMKTEGCPSSQTATIPARNTSRRRYLASQMYNTECSSPVGSGETWSRRSCFVRGCCSGEYGRYKTSYDGSRTGSYNCGWRLDPGAQGTSDYKLNLQKYLALFNESYYKHMYIYLTCLISESIAADGNMVLETF